ncbi:MAG: hypothetical protein ACOCYW_06540, partial [Roseicyclus sp.]
YMRQSDPPDPQGDTVRTAIAWLDEDRALVSVGQIDDTAPDVTDGSLSRSLDITADDAPSGAVYLRPYVQTYGSDGVTDVALVQIGLPQTALPPVPALRLIGTVPFENLPDEVGEDRPVARTFYVTADGDDSYSGDSLSKPLASVERAVEKMDAEGENCIAFVYPNDETYVVPPDLEVPDKCEIQGMGYYTVSMGLPSGEEENNMFLLGNGSKLKGITFTNLRHEEYALDPATETYDPPKKGFAVAFKPGAFITRLPYVEQCAMRGSVLRDLDVMNGPVDRAAGNPDMPRGGGCMMLDPGVLDPNSPQKAIIAFSFTAVNPNGIAYMIYDDAFTQLVSIYTNYSRVGLWAHNGPTVTMKNGDSTFGDYSFVASGAGQAIRIPDNIISAPSENDSAAAAIDNNVEAIVSDAETRWAQRSWWGAFSSEQREFTRRDTRTLLKYLADDLRAGQILGMQQFTKGLFVGAEYVFDSSLLSAFLESFADIEDAIVSVTSIARGPVSSLISIPETVLATPGDYRIARPSSIKAQPHGMSWCGTGVNLRARPYWQGGVGVTIPPDATIIEQGGGKADVTWLDQRGWQRLARGLYVNADRGTIEGRAFRRSVQATTLPLIVALGG